MQNKGAMSLEEMCRACLRSNGTLSSLLDSIVPKLDSSPPASVVDIWTVFTKILKATEDKLPNKICTDCLVEIQTTYSFILKCERSEEILKKMKNDEICLERLGTVSLLRADVSSKNIKTENDIYPNFTQIKNENIELDDRITGSDKEDKDRGQFQEIIDTNVYGQSEPESEQKLIVQQEDVNFKIELLDRLDYDVDVTKDKISAIQDIKQESVLDISTEKGEFDEIEEEIASEGESITEIVACPGCRFECRILERLEKHIIETHMDEQMCKLCNQEFECSPTEHCSKHILKSTILKQNLMYHVRSQNHTVDGTDRPFKCASCSKTFARKETLTEHLIQHMDEAPFKCEICSKTFLRKSKLMDHLICHRKRPFKCESCSKTFTSKKTLTSHLRLHTEDRPFKCKICPKTYARKPGLTDHLRRHTGERPFKCETCSKTFIRKDNLIEHLKFHTAERTFKCEECPKSFLRKSDLMNHSRCHTGERPFNCEICHKAYGRKSSLTVHLRQHTEERM